jgi:hypothetical protein
LSGHVGWVGCGGMCIDGGCASIDACISVDLGRRGHTYTYTHTHLQKKTHTTTIHAIKQTPMHTSVMPRIRCTGSCTCSSTPYSAWLFLCVLGEVFEIVSGEGRQYTSIRYTPTHDHIHTYIHVWGLPIHTSDDTPPPTHKYTHIRNAHLGLAFPSVGLGSIPSHIRRYSPPSPYIHPQHIQITYLGLSSSSAGLGSIPSQVRRYPPRISSWSNTSSSTRSSPLAAVPGSAVYGYGCRLSWNVGRAMIRFKCMNVGGWLVGYI